jgi:hypothetical protein
MNPQCIEKHRFLGSINFFFYLGNFMKKQFNIISEEETVKGKKQKLEFLLLDEKRKKAFFHFNNLPIKCGY